MKKSLFVAATVMLTALFYGCKTAPDTRIDEIKGTWTFDGEYEYDLGITKFDVNVSNTYEFQENGTWHMYSKYQDGIIAEAVGIYEIDEENSEIIIHKFEGQTVAGSSVARDVLIYSYSYENHKLKLVDEMTEEETKLSKANTAKNHQETGLEGMWICAGDDDQGYFQERYFLNPDFTVTKEYSNDNNEKTTQIGTYEIADSKITFKMEKEITVKDEPADGEESEEGEEEEESEHTEIIIESFEMTLAYDDVELKLTDAKGTKTYLRACNYTRDDLVAVWKGTKTSDKATVIYLSLNQDGQYTWYSQKSGEEKVLVTSGTFTHTVGSSNNNRLYLYNKETEENIEYTYNMNGDNSLTVQKNASIYKFSRM